MKTFKETKSKNIKFARHRLYVTIARVNNVRGIHYLVVIMNNPCRHEELSQIRQMPSTASIWRFFHVFLNLEQDIKYPCGVLVLVADAVTCVVPDHVSHLFLMF